MAGIYIHIPFCRDACHYCDFHFTTSYFSANEMVDALCREIIHRKLYLSGKELNTIYFGGGTPSSLPALRIKQILVTIYDHYPVAENPEITLEANPDDLGPGYLDKIREIGINRLSVGIQSFFDEDLRWMNRTHNAIQAITCIKHSQKAGFDNLNADLIYGFPLMTDEKWTDNLKKIIDLNVPHVSAYHLTYEQGTVLHYNKEKKREQELPEKESIHQFHLLTGQLKSTGFIHYEISNFAKKGFFSIHNLGYWSQQPYIGIGPSAHSYNGISRQWNYARNKSYMEAMSHNKEFFKREFLDDEKKFHEYIMTSLRTMWGIDLEYIEQHFSKELLLNTLDKSNQYIHSGYITKKDNKLILTDKGKLISDHMIRDLFL